MSNLPDGRLRIVFMGTPEFGVPTLRRLSSGGGLVVAVVTQPDRPRGRGRNPAPPPVKVAALELDISVLQPARIDEPDFIARLKELSPHVIVVAAYGKILPPEILDLPQYGCLNVHASLLPRYRGAAPINWAIIQGESITGITIMQMNEGMDTGDILLQREIEIGPEETAGELFERLKQVGADALADALDRLRAGTLRPVPQDDDRATLAPLLVKENGRIRWEQSAVEIHDFVRGMSPWPGAFTTIDSRLLKVHRCRVGGGDMEVPPGAEPGEVIGVGIGSSGAEAGGISVVTGDGMIILTEVQLQDRRRMAAAEFAKGIRLAASTKLGEDI